MKKYNLLNNVTGWVVFAIATFTYISTIEPTASLWDCSEYILSAYKLEVGHPSGAPLFMMLGRLFAMLATPDKVAIMVNIFSSLCSSFTILFLFWSITHLARRFFSTLPSEYGAAEYSMILGSGAVGALAYTFSDTFWFSAVEGEVYAASSLLTAVVFWLGLKWEEQADSKYANRWLVLLAYIIGLSIGVHLLNLLVVPAIVFIYYFKKYPVTKNGLIKTSLLSIILLASLVWGVIPIVPKIGSWVELAFVNGMGMPINSGVVVYVILLIAVLSFGVYYTRKKGQVILNTIMLCLTVCILGYGSYAMIVLRSSANPPMDQNSPDNIFSLMSYLNRDQYGSRPLLTGPYYSNTNGTPSVKFNYVKVGDKYKKEEWKQNVKYDQTILFPRMYSEDPSHVEVYKQFLSKGRTTPSYANNINFFLDYQIDYMYWRYFMWNFVGRQNDMQSNKGDLTRGNWISGINFIDEARLGPQDNLPLYMKENNGRNKYFFLPLLLGLLGLAYQLFKDKRGFTVVTLLFFFTGLAIVIYLNQPPNEPRERDYAYAGSFYAFAIWIGLGVLALGKILSRYSAPKIAGALAVIITLPIPALMAQQNWDDHDRSGRYVCADLGYNYLNSCEKEAILFTYGDNDTFALWYNQGVEGQRTDVKVANTMYLSADWYYAQMMRRTYDAPPIKTKATPENIAGSIRNIVPVQERIKTPIDMNMTLDFIFSDSKENKFSVPYLGNQMLNYCPARELRLNIDRDKSIANFKLDTTSVIPYFQFKLPGMLYKNNLAILDIVANNFNERPIYYGGGGEEKLNMGVENNLRQEGLVHRLVPENTSVTGRMDVDKTFELVTKVYKYRGVGDLNVYMDETARRMSTTYRFIVFSLADYLEQTGDKPRLKVLADMFKDSFTELRIVNQLHTPYLRFSNPAVKLYFAADKNEEGKQLANTLIEEYMAEIRYYLALQRTKKINVDYEMSASYQGLIDLKNIASKYNQTDVMNEANKQIELLNQMVK